MTKRCLHNLFMCMAFMFMTACSMIKPAMPPLASVEGVTGHFSVGRIIHLEKGEAVSFDELINQLGTKKLIFVGEAHNNPDHHLIQVQILQALMIRYAPLTIAMEFFQRPVQPVLDRYMDGATTEDVFLKDVGWHKNWAYDYHFYRPLMLLIRQNSGKTLAINAPIDIVRKVARSGLGSLEPNERDQLARRIDLGNKPHRAYVHKIYQKHTHQDLMRFDYFYQAQCVWEDTMAESIAAYLEKHKEKLVVFCGNGHIINKYGIPNRTISRSAVPMATLVLHTLTGPLTIKKELGDYVWLTAGYSR